MRKPLDRKPPSQTLKSSRFHQLSLLAAALTVLHFFILFPYRERRILFSHLRSRHFGVFCLLKLMRIYSIFNFLILFLCGMRNDVFLSFNFKETGKKFSDHLHSAISGAGFGTFVAASNNGNLHFETIKKEIEKSRVSVAVFSKDFAWSSRCLDELATMMEARNKSGLVVLPIFYHADPSELRWLKGRYGEAFAEHEKRYAEERVSEWKAALTEVSYLQGMVLRSARAVDFLHKIALV